MRKCTGFLLFVVLSAVLFAGCKGKSNNNVLFFPEEELTGGLLATGGTGSTGSGGTGGQLYLNSTGAANVLKTGFVDASFVVSEPTPSFGPVHAVISSGTTTSVQLDIDGIDGGLYTKAGNPRLYLGNNDGNTANDPEVTGLTVEAGASLVLVDQGYWGGSSVAHFSNDMVIEGTLAADTGKGLYIEANLVLVGSTGTITTSATTTDYGAADMYIGNAIGVTHKIINHGTIEAKGLGSGNGGYMYMEADDLIANYGTIDVSGGSSDTGSGGSCLQWDSLDIYVDYGNFYSSGTIRMNGGDGGGAGGNGGQAWIETAYSGNDNGMNGDIILRGTLEAIGGKGDAGNGGGNGYFGFETDAMGKIAVNATMTIKGGKGSSAGASGGSPGGIEFYSYDYSSLTVTTPGNIAISGSIDLSGGDGDGGGNAGYLGLYSDTVDIEVIGFPVFYLNGGDGPVTGGAGGYAGITASGVINNTSAIIISGGMGDTGGGLYGGGGDSLYFSGFHVTTTGKLTANGGKGTTTGGAGGNITINSTGGTSSSANRADMSVAGGAPNGSPGIITIDGSPI